MVSNNKSEDRTNIIQKRVRDLETGMVLAKPVYSSNGCTLLQEGTILNTRDIDRLRSWNKRYAYVEPPEDSSNESNTFARAS